MTEVRLINEDGQPAAPGEVGELYSRSPFLMSGYHNNPEATARSTTDDGFFSAGDLATMDEEGFFYIVDRKKDMIISGGANIYPREVEEVLIEHPDVVDVAVIGRPSEEWGERVAALVVLRPGADMDEATLDQHCRRSLAGYKVPRSYSAVDELPRNAAGKILKRDLRSEPES
jgi:long-chain acyl-CoA synthetase